LAPKHGGNLKALAVRAGRNPDSILDFSASINPLGPPECLRAVLSRTVDQLVHYPDPDCTELVHAIAAWHRGHSRPLHGETETNLPPSRIIPEHIVAANGSSEIFVALARALPFRRAVIPVPSYTEYAAAARMAGRDVRFLPLPLHQELSLDWPALESELQPGDAVFLGQPNNPTGMSFDVLRLRALAQQHPASLFVVDEAFADFVEGYRSLAADATENLVVVRSFTKFFAIPGLRLGYAVAAPRLAAEIQAQIPPWSVGTLAQAAGVAVLADEDYARQTRAYVSCQRQQLAHSLAHIPSLYVYPSAANFLLVRLDRPDLAAAALAERLLCDGIAIRTFDPSEHLDQRFFRVAVRTAEENQRLCDALDAILGNRQGRGRFSAERRRATVDEHGPAPFPDVARATRKPKPALMIQGTSSNAGKSVLVAALCRILLQDGVRVAPFKAQNMSLNSFVTRDGGEMGRAQVVQAQACRLEPDVRMNPVLLKPCSDTGSQVIVRGKPVGNMRVAEYLAYKPKAFAVVQECYDALAAQFDAIVLEGAGSPGEVNLKSHDIVNMRMAHYANAPVVIVGDIDRGGVFAAFVGTMEVLAAWERKLVAGWIVNRFRGDATLLDPALEYTLRHTGRPVLGVVPYLAGIDLPQEDSVEFKSGALDPVGAGAAVEVAVIDLPHISNFTDFDPLRIESDVRVRIVRSAAELGRPDAVILPGSKNTLNDLAYLRASGLADRIAALAHQGAAEIVGICGGFQMIGREICDPRGVESAEGKSCGLGLMAASTVLAEEKTLVRTTARHGPSGLDVTGYEIHHGQTTIDGSLAVFTRPDGQAVGAARPDHRVWGTYLHGVFDADEFRRWFIDRLRTRRGLPALGCATSRYDIQPALDRLAEAVRRSLRIDEIYRIMGLR